MAPPVERRSLDRKQIIDQFSRGLDVSAMQARRPAQKSSNVDGERLLRIAADDRRPTDTVISGTEDVNELADYILGQTPATRGQPLSARQLERALTLYRTLSLELARQHGLSPADVGFAGPESTRVSVGIGSQGQGRRDPPRSVSDPEAQRRALETVRTALDTRGVFDWGVSADEARTAVDAISGLSATDARAVVRILHQEGLLDQLTKSLQTHGDSRAGAAVRARFSESMSNKLDGATLATLAASMRSAGEDTRLAFVAAINREASVQTKHEFVRAAAGLTTDGTPTASDLDSFLGGSTHTRFVSDGDAVTVAGVISSLRGQDVVDALGVLSPAQRASVYQGAANVRNLTMTTVGMGVASTSYHASADGGGFDAFIDAMGSVSDPRLRAEYLSEGLMALGLADDAARSRLARDEGASLPPLGAELPMHHRSTMASRVLRHVDDDTLAHLSPDGIAVVAEGLAHSRPGIVAALRKINGFAPIPQRDALVRTMFLKTPQSSLRDDAALVDAFADGLAAGQGGDAQARSADTLRRTLSTANGRALLADHRIPGAARLWAAIELMKRPDAIQDALSSDRPWEDEGLLDIYARSRVRQFEARGDRAVAVGGWDIDNLVGAGLRAPTRSDLPNTKEEMAQALAGDGSYNFYHNVEVVRRIAGDPNQNPPGGIRGAQRQMGGGPVRVATLPVQFSSQATGPVDLQIYRVEGRNRQQRFVDNVGRIYESFEAWRKGNELPPGKMTFAAGGHLGAPGRTQLVTENTPDVSDTFLEHVGDVADVAALGGGILASGVIVLGSGGTATPLLVTAWTVALGSAGYMGIQAGMDLYDRQAHGQTLSMSDPDARAAWLSLAGSGLTVVGAGTMGAATRLAKHGSSLAPTMARAAGILNTSANYADASASLDQAHTLVVDWDKLTPAQRAQMGLTIAFWGGMVGVSTKASGGRISDAFSFRAQIRSALIESGAVVRPRPDTAAGQTGRGRGAIPADSPALSAAARRALSDVAEVAPYASRRDLAVLQRLTGEDPDTMIRLMREHPHDVLWQVQRGASDNVAALKQGLEQQVQDLAQFAARIEDPETTRADRKKVVARLRTDFDSTTGDLEGLVLDSSLQQNREALRNIATRLADEDPDIIVGMKNGGAFLTEALGLIDPSLIPKVRTIDSHRAPKTENRSGKFDAPKQQAELEPMIADGAKSIVFVDSYMGGYTASSLLDQIFLPLAERHPDVNFGVNWLRETMGFSDRPNVDGVLSRRSPYAGQIREPNVERVGMIVGDDMDMVYTDSREPIRLFDRQGHITRVVEPGEGEMTRNVLLRLLTEETP